MRQQERQKALKAWLRWEAATQARWETTQPPEEPPPPPPEGTPERREWEERYAHLRPDVQAEVARVQAEIAQRETAQQAGPHTEIPPASLSSSLDESIWVIGKDGQVYGYIDPTHADDKKAEEIVSAFQGSETGYIDILYNILSNKTTENFLSFSISKGFLTFEVRPALFFDVKFVLPQNLSLQERRINAYYAYLYLNELHEQSQGILATATERILQKAQELAFFPWMARKVEHFRTRVNPLVVGGQNSYYSIEDLPSNHLAGLMAFHQWNWGSLKDALRPYIVQTIPKQQWELIKSQLPKNFETTLCSEAGCLPWTQIDPKFAPPDPLPKEKQFQVVSETFRIGGEIKLKMGSWEKAIQLSIPTPWSWWKHHFSP